MANNTNVVQPQQDSGERNIGNPENKDEQDVLQQSDSHGNNKPQDPKENAEHNFSTIKKQLIRMSEELDEACVVQENDEFNKAKIEKILREIDSFISNDSVIRQARIEGKSDVQNIIDFINGKVLAKLAELKSKVSDDKKKEVERVEVAYNSNTTNTVQRKLDYIDKSLKTLTPQERQEAAEKRVNELEGIFAALPKWKEKLKENGEETYEELVLRNIEDIKYQLNEIAHRHQTRLTLKNPSKRKELGELYNKFCEKVRSGKKLDEQDYREILDRMLKPFRGVEQIDVIISAFSEDGDTISVDTKKLAEVVSQNQQIDFEAADEYYKKQNISELKRLLETGEIFKTYADQDAFPKNAEKLREWLRKLEGQEPDIELLVREIRQEIVVEGPKRVNDLMRATKKHDTVKNELKRAKKVRESLAKFNERTCTTTTRKIFGKYLEILDENGNPQDIAKIDLENHNIDYIDILYQDLVTNSNTEELKDIEATFQRERTIPKAGFFKRLGYKITHPQTWGDGHGLSSYEVACREEWIKGKIRAEVQAIQQEAKARENSRDPKKSWVISPEDMEAFRKADEERILKAKIRANKNIVYGLNIEDAMDLALEQFSREQGDADLEL